MDGKSKQNLQSWFQCEKGQISRRLEASEGGREPLRSGPELGAQTIHYEASSRIHAIPSGGIGVIHQLVGKVGLAKALDSQLHMLKRHRPYTESDHILNIVYNVMCGGQVLDDIEVRRKDRGFLDALGARSIPDPTTAGDFCRRFQGKTVEQLMSIVNEVRLRVWKQQPAEFFEQTARIDADGTLVETRGECKEGMDVAYNGVWGYHPLLISLANTGEPLYIFNRSGNRPSHEGAPNYFDQAISLCRRAGWKNILLRGDTSFSQAAHLDHWDDDDVRFVFGYKAVKRLVDCADAIEDSEYHELQRKADIVLDDCQKRAKQPRIKEEIIRQRGYSNLRLVQEDIAEFEYQPSKAKRSYRVVVLCKTILEEKGQIALGQRDRYFFYITNDRTMTAEQVVREANQRCNQENLIEQLKNGVRAFRAPLNTLESNWAYMVIVSLAWSLKAWLALLTPISPRWREKHQAERERVLRMDFRTFLQCLILVPAQILRTGRRLVYRLLAWRPELPILFRFLDTL